MRNELIRGTVRIERREVSEMPSPWTKEERGRYLWRLLQGKGIDPSRLYTVEYFPYRQCWLLTQEVETAQRPRHTQSPPPGAAGGRFYVQALAEFRRTALTAFAASAARSAHFARFGCKYQLPPKPQETTPADLVRLLGGSAEDDARVRFDSEGGWHIEPSA